MPRASALSCVWFEGLCEGLCGVVVGLESELVLFPLPLLSLSGEEEECDDVEVCNALVLADQ